MKEPYHQAAVLFFLEEKSVDEIAAALRRPLKTVHTQIYRAKQLLQNAIERGNGHGIVQ
ncbi:MAG: sigma factor-like helix-turn-helix DNA-binding protein [Ruthenibacterium lactatiformans]